MNSSFEFTTALEYRLKAAKEELQAFKSGEKYVRMEEQRLKEVRALERIIAKMKKELEESHRRERLIRKQWFEVFEQMEKEHARLLKAVRKETAQMEKRALKAERERDEALSKLAEKRRQLYEMEAKLEDMTEKNRLLTAQMNRDYENSSIPSSKSVKPKKIPNSREKTGRKPGAQPGHKGHCRKRQEPTMPPVLLLPPQEILDDPDFKKTKKTIVKQLVNIRLLVEVTEYHADIYYNSKTGEHFHASFPEGVKDDVNYGGSIRAFLFLLNNDCCTSIDKSRKFLSDLTEGKLNISKGMINKLSRTFAEKTEAERKKIFADMLLSPVMHVDCTNANVNGNSAYVFVCATPDRRVLYFAREAKGHKGVKGTVAEDYQGILVHDGETTFHNYGSGHQECLAHILRGLKGCAENEPERPWYKQMHSLLQEMLHYRNHLPEDRSPDSDTVSRYEGRYDEILQTAKEDYENIPPEKYYRDGYNLYLRLSRLKESHLLFLHDPRVPATNNTAEQFVRVYKRKQKQAVSLRSQNSLDNLCGSMSVLVEMRKNENNNLFKEVSNIFEKKKTEGSD